MRLEQTGFLKDHAGKASSTRLAGLILIFASVVLAFMPSPNPVILLQMLASGLACLGIRTKDVFHAS